MAQFLSLLEILIFKIYTLQLSKIHNVVHYPNSNNQPQSKGSQQLSREELLKKDIESRPEFNTNQPIFQPKSVTKTGLKPKILSYDQVHPIQLQGNIIKQKLLQNQDINKKSELDENVTQKNMLEGIQLEQNSSPKNEQQNAPQEQEAPKSNNFYQQKDQNYYYQQFMKQNAFQQANPQSAADNDSFEAVEQEVENIEKEKTQSTLYAKTDNTSTNQQTNVQAPVNLKQAAQQQAKIQQNDQLQQISQNNQKIAEQNQNVQKQIILQRKAPQAMGGVMDSFKLMQQNAEDMENKEEAHPQVASQQSQLRSKQTDNEDQNKLQQQNLQQNQVMNTKTQQQNVTNNQKIIPQVQSNTSARQDNNNSKASNIQQQSKNSVGKVSQNDMKPLQDLKSKILNERNNVLQSNQKIQENVQQIQNKANANNQKIASNSGPMVDLGMPSQLQSQQQIKPVTSQKGRDQPKINQNQLQIAQQHGSSEKQAQQNINIDGSQQIKQQEENPRTGPVCSNCKQPILSGQEIAFGIGQQQNAQMLCQFCIMKKQDQVREQQQQLVMQIQAQQFEAQQKIEQQLQLEQQQLEKQKQFEIQQMVLLEKQKQEQIDNENRIKMQEQQIQQNIIDNEENIDQNYVDDVDSGQQQIPVDNNGYQQGQPQQSSSFQQQYMNEGDQAANQINLSNRQQVTQGQLRAQISLQNGKQQNNAILDDQISKNLIGNNQDVTQPQVNAQKQPATQNIGLQVSRQTRQKPAVTQLANQYQNNNTQQPQFQHKHQVQPQSEQFQLFNTLNNLNHQILQSFPFVIKKRICSCCGDVLGIFIEDQHGDEVSNEEMLKTLTKRQSDMRDDENEQNGKKNTKCNTNNNRQQQQKQMDNEDYNYQEQSLKEDEVKIKLKSGQNYQYNGYEKSYNKNQITKQKLMELDDKLAQLQINERKSIDMDIILQQQKIDQQKQLSSSEVIEDLGFNVRKK